MPPKDPGALKGLSPEEKLAKQREWGSQSWSKSNGKKDKDLSHEGRVRRQKVFLEALAEYGTIKAACRVIDIARKTYYDWIDRYPEFKSLVEAAMEEFTDDLETVAYDRAKDKSDLLLMFTLKKRRPEFRDNYQEPVGKPEEEEAQAVASDEVTKKLNTLAQRRIERLTGATTPQEIERSHEEVEEDEEDEEEPADAKVISLKRKRA